MSDDRTRPSSGGVGREVLMTITMRCPGCGHNKETPGGGIGWRCPKCDGELETAKPKPAKLVAPEVERR
jgi:tRNA(Ile2) C34 agmatinyltransferase TiaS